MQRAVGNGDVDPLDRLDAAKALDDMVGGKHGPFDVGCRPQELRSGSTSMRRADIAASSTSFLRNGASSRSPTPTRPVGEYTMKATNTRPNQNSQFSV
jgi:hypothetical protein